MTSDPRYKHDCDKCVFLGRYRAHNEKHNDLYFCGSGILATVIARYGDDGPDCMSGLENLSGNQVLAEAAKRAIRLLARYPTQLAP